MLHSHGMRRMALVAALLSAGATLGPLPAAAGQPVVTSSPEGQRSEPLSMASALSRAQQLFVLQEGRGRIAQRRPGFYWPGRKAAWAMRKDGSWSSRRGPCRVR